MQSMKFDSGSEENLKSSIHQAGRIYMLKEICCLYGDWFDKQVGVEEKLVPD
jgi:hypothetical protein